VTDQAGRQVNLIHEVHGADNENVCTLRSVTDPTGQTTTFRYIWKAWGTREYHHQITEVEWPVGNIPYTQAYDIQKLNGVTASRVISQTDAYGHTTSFTYDPAAVKVTENRPDGTTQVYEHCGLHIPPKSLTDPTGDAEGNTADLWRGIGYRYTSVMVGTFS